MAENYLKENQIHCLINPQVKPLLHTVSDIDYVYYAWNNVLLKFNVKAGSIISSMKVSVNPICSLILDAECNSIYGLTLHSELHSSEIFRFNINSQTISKRYVFDNKFDEKNRVKAIQLEKNSNSLIVLTDTSLIKFGLSSFEVISEIYFSGFFEKSEYLYCSDFVTLKSNVTLISHVCIINLYQALLLVNILTGQHLLISDPSIRNIISIVAITKADKEYNFDNINKGILEERQVELDNIKIVVADKLGKIHTISGFLVLENASIIDEGNVKFTESYIISSVHWHSSGCILDTNAFNIFSGSDEGTLVAWDINTLNKTFFPRLCRKIFQITSSDTSVVIVSSDQLIVYNYLENKFAGSLNFLDVNLDDLIQIEQNGFEDEGQSYTGFYNKITSILYFVSLNGKGVKRANLLQGNIHNSTFNSKKHINKAKEFPKLLSSSEISFLSVSSLNLDTEKHIILTTIDEISLEYQTISYLKTWRIDDLDKQNLTPILISVACNPHGSNKINFLKVYKEKSEIILITAANDSSEDESVIKIWKATANAFVNAYTIRIGCEDSSSKLSLCCYFNSSIDSFYLIALSNHQLIKYNLSTYEVDSRAYIPISHSVSSKIEIDGKNENLLVVNHNKIFCYELSNLRLIWEDILEKDEMAIIDLNFSKADNSLVALLQNTQNKLYTIYTFNDIASPEAPRFSIFKLQNIREIKFSGKSKLLVMRRGHQFNQTLSIFDIGSLKGQSFTEFKNLKRNKEEIAELPKRQYKDSTKQSIMSIFSSKANEEESDFDITNDDYKTASSLMEDKLKSLRIKPKK